MITFKATLDKFRQKGEKTGWTYITIPARLAQKLKPGTRKSFRVKGRLDGYALKQVALIPMGDGDFIIPINTGMRKAIRKQAGDTIAVALEEDKSELTLSEDLLVCLEDEPAALANFKKLTPGHQRYFSNWIESAKTAATKTKRITQSVQGLVMGMNYGEMIRYFKNNE